jgi:hypothetical protein
MTRILIVPAMLLALAACTESPTAPAPLHSPVVRHDANPGIGSGAGLAPPDGGEPGSGARADEAPGIGAGVGLLPWDETGQLGSGNDVVGSTDADGGTLAGPGATIVGEGGILGSGT